MWKTRERKEEPVRTQYKEKSHEISWRTGLKPGQKHVCGEKQAQEHAKKGIFPIDWYSRIWKHLTFSAAAIAIFSHDDYYPYALPSDSNRRAMKPLNPANDGWKNEKTGEKTTKCHCFHQKTGWKPRSDKHQATFSSRILRCGITAEIR